MSDVKELQKLLSLYKPDEKLIMAWWDKEWFEVVLDRKLNDEEWDVVIASGIEALEYNQFGDVLMDCAERALYEYSKKLETLKGNSTNV